MSLINNTKKDGILKPPRRTTIIPSNSGLNPRKSIIAPSTFKSRQLSYLNSEIAKLQANMGDLDNLLQVTAVQADFIRKLGIIHASL